MKDFDFKALWKNLLLTIEIILFIKIFSGIFGPINTLIGVAVISGILMFKDMNLEYDIKQSAFLIVVLYTYMALVTSLHNINIILMFLINVVSIFFVIYLTSENLPYKAYITFILLYIFMEANPTSGSKEFYMRLASAIIGGILVSLTLFFSQRKLKIDKKIKDAFNNLDIKSERFRFSIKMAFGIALAILIGTLIGTQKGMWISISVMSLTQPSHKDVKERIRKRFIGTIIGAIGFVIVFEIIVPEQYYVLLSLGLSYLFTFINEYFTKIIFITISALTSAMVLFDSGISISLRIGFLCIGIVITYILSKLDTIIMNRNNENSNNEIYV